MGNNLSRGAGDVAVLLRKVTLEVIGSMEIGSERKTVALSLNLM